METPSTPELPLTLDELMDSLADLSMETPSTPELLPQTPAATVQQPQSMSKPRGASVPLPAVDDDREPASPHDRGKPPGAQIAHQGQRRRRILAAGVVVALATLVVGAQYYLSIRRHESTDDASSTGPIVHVAPQVAGRVLQVLVTANQAVQAGDLLVEIDSVDLSVRLVQALASAAEARGRLEQARWQLVVAEAARALAEADIVAARAPRRNTTAKRTAALQLTVAQIKEAAAVARINLARSQIETAEAGVDTAEAAVEQAQLQLAYTEVRAPRSGHVRTKNVEPGDYVQVGQELLTLVSDDLGGPGLP